MVFESGCGGSRSVQVDVQQGNRQVQQSPGHGTYSCNGSGSPLSPARPASGMLGDDLRSPCAETSFMPSSKHLLVGSVLLALLAVRLSAAADEKDTALEEDETLVRDAKEPTDTAGLVAFFRKRTLSETDRAALQGLVEQLGARSFAKREDASRRLVRWGMPAKAFLEPATRSTDAEIARRARLCLDEIALGPGPSLPCAAARLLARRRPSEAIPVLLGYLPYADDEAVRDEILAALLTLAQDKDKTRLAPLAPALKDTLPLKRAAAAYVLTLRPQGRPRPRQETPRRQGSRRPASRCPGTPRRSRQGRRPRADRLARRPAGGHRLAG